MEVADLILDLKKKNIKIHLNGDQIKVNGPKDLLTKEVVARISNNKSAIVSFLKEFSNQNQLKAIEEQDYYSTSHTQRRFWFIHQFDPGLNVYNIPSVVRLKGDLNISTLKSALDAVIRRHEILRTYYVVVDGEVKQKVMSPDLDQHVLKFTDVSVYPNASECAEHLMKEEIAKPFELGAEAMIRANLICYASDSYLFSVTVHHSVFDGWSVGVLLNDLSFFYGRAATSSEFPPLLVQYKDFVAWQNEWTHNDHSEAERYWIEKLSGTLPAINFPQAARRPAIKTYNNANVTISFDKETSDDFKQLAIKNNVTPYAVALGVFKILLLRYTGQTDTIIGTPVSGRPLSILETQIGLYLNTLALRSTVDPNATFHSLLPELQNLILEAHRFQDYPFEKLISKLNVERDPSRSPVFDIMFVSLDFVANSTLPVVLENLTAEAVESDFSGNKFDLTLYFSLQDKTLEISYNTDLFSKKFISLFLQHYLLLFKSLAQNETWPVFKHDFITDQEKNFVFGDFNNTIEAYSSNLRMHDLFERQVRSTPAKIAIEDHDTSVTYDELNKRSNQIARSLVMKGTRAGDTVALISGRNINMIAGMLAILKAGGTYVPIDPLYPVKRKEYILTQARAKFVLYEEEIDLADVQTPASVSMKDPSIASLDETNLELIISPKALAYIIFTSGSTGNPKGVMIEHHSAVNLIEWVNRQFSVNQSDRLLFLTSMCFDLSVYDIFGILAASGTIVIANTEDLQSPARLVKMLELKKITFWDSVPSTMLYLLNAIDSENPSLLNHDLRIVFMSGDWIPVDLPNRITKYFPSAKPISLGGATEATVWSNFYEIEKVNPEWASIPYGKPISNNFFYILDNTLRMVPEGVVGELYIGGVGVARGYANDKERTDIAFLPDPFIQECGGMMYRTGDLGRMMPDGNMEFLGREDRQVKIRGFRVGLGEIETVLLKHDDIRNAVVIDKADVDKTKYLVAYYESQRELESAELYEFLISTLPSYMVPSQFVRLDNIPLNSNGKIDRAALPEAGARKETKAQRHVMNATELALKKIWEEVLSRNEVSLSDNFFEIGGHSLNSTRLIGKIHELLGVRLELRALFSHPTIQKMASLLSHTQQSEIKKIEPIEEQDHYQVSPAQRRLWVLAQMEESSMAYHEYWSQWVDGDLSQEVVKMVFGELVRRHEILRTRFIAINGDPKQRVMDAGSNALDFSFLDISENPDKQELHDKLIKEQREVLLDIESGPLMKIVLIRYDRSRTFFMLTLHHIICDGWSLEVMIREFFELYKSLSGELPVHIRPNEIQYKDYTAWQNTMLKDSSREEAKSFWHEKLKGELPVLDVPLYHSRPSVQTYNGKGVIHPLAPAVESAVRQMAAKGGATLFMTFVGVLNVLLHKYSNQEDIILGTIDAGRDHPDLENQVGYYLNTVALRSAINPEDTFSVLLGKVKTTVLEALAFKHYPFEWLIKELNVKRDVSRSPVFDVLVEVNQFGGLLGDEAGASDLLSSDVEIERTTSIYDLNFVLHDENNAMLLEIHYNSDLFTDDQIANYHKHLEHLVLEIITKPQNTIASLRLVTNEEEQILFTLAGRDEMLHPSKTGIIDFLQQSVIASPEAIVYRDAHESISFRDLDLITNSLAKLINKRKSESGSIIGVMVDRTIQLPKAIIAIWKAGCAYVPLDTDMPIERLKWIADDTAMQVILCDEKCYHLADQLLWECVTLNDLICIDSANVYAIEEPELASMSQDLWRSVAERAKDDISAGGWVSSYTGEFFSRREMDEYADNIVHKLTPLLNSKTRVLEIGCASGISMFRIAPRVQHYHGIDMSSEILKINQEKIESLGLKNISQQCMYAHEIGQLKGQVFDIIIINSVIQNFSGTNYLNTVLENCIGLLAETGSIFIGDIMDVDRKYDLLSDLKKFKSEHIGKGYKTTTEFPNHKFYSKKFFDNFSIEHLSVVEAEYSEKIFTIPNEITRFRFDCILTIDQRITKPLRKINKGHKFKFDQRSMNEGLPVTTFIDGSSLAYVLYTSGSTGRPKGVMIDHSGMLNHIMLKIKDMQMSKHTVMAQIAPMTFDISVWQLFCGLVTGARTIIYDRQTVLAPEKLLGSMAEDGINVMEVVPSYLVPLLECSPHLLQRSFANLKYMVVTAEILQPLLVRKWFEKFPGIKMVNAYGPTEASDDITHYLMDQCPDLDSIPIGKPLANFRIYVLDSQMRPCPLGVKGELYVQGLGLGRGYLNDQEKTHTTFIHSPFSNDRIYKTGDVGRVLPDGNIQFYGRKDFQVKVRGHRIELSEIEKVISSSPIVKEAVVHTVEQREEVIICAYVNFHSGLERPDEDLRKHISQMLPNYMMPAYIVVMETFPRLPNGKVDRKVLANPTIENDQLNYVGPVNAKEETLVAVWKKVLDKTRVSTDQKFFDVGGDSIKAIQMISRLLNEGWRLDIRDIYQHQSISALAVCLKPVIRFAEQAPVTGVIPLTPIQRYFFDEFKTDMHHYNQAVMLSFNGRIDKHALQAVFEKIQNHHDALRTTFQFEEGRIVQKINTGHPSLEIISVDLRKSFQFDSELETQADQIQSSINLEQGPLMKIAVFNLPSDDRILIVFHHLVIDGISWRILLEDFQTLYQMSTSNEPLELPLKTDSYKLWSERISAYAVSSSSLREIDYWRDRVNVPPARIPADRADVGELIIGKREQTSFSLSVHETELLLTRVNRAFNTEINDILISALALALKNSYGFNTLSLSLEGHGRENILSDVDISRTVGWFSSEFPVAIRFEQAEELSSLVKTVKDELHRIPNKGIGFGILKYITSEKYTTGLENASDPQIGFNYLGQFDSETKAMDSVWKGARESFGRTQSAAHRVRHELDISGIISNDVLSMTIFFNNSQFDETTIRNLCDVYRTALVEIINYCSTRENAESTPSDFSYKDLSQDELDNIF